MSDKKRSYRSPSDTILNGCKEEILRQLAVGVPKTSIQEQFKVSYPTLQKKLKEWGV